MRSKRGWFMRFLCALLLACLNFSSDAMLSAQAPPSPYRLAIPGYRYSFPRDYFNHPDFQTEWWYYTGNVQSADGHRFGFELTFFREGVHRDSTGNSAWDVRDLYLAHLALSDLDGGRFYHTERINRSGPGIAGADEATQRIWNGNWQVQWRNSDQELQAISEQFELHFTLHSEKPPVIHGENGVSQKAEGAGRASHYISLTRLTTRGRIVLDGKSFEVSGLTWMDHEFFTNQLAPEQAGWDWLSLQLDDRTELMLFHIRRADGSIDSFSSGTYVDAQGRTTHLRKNDFVLEPLADVWKSPATGAAYPIRWKISIPKIEINLEATTPLRSQELAGDARFAPTYWEGAIMLTGTRASRAISGRGYLEMTGYSHPIRFAP
jgi:predicted secreted hydrolase